MLGGSDARLTPATGIESIRTTRPGGRMLLVPTNQTQYEEAYEWLTRALIQYCDQVEARLSEAEGTFSIAAVWQRGSNKMRVCLAVENAMAGKSLNQDITDGELTQNEAIRLFTKRRPQWR
jgi:hypothetical protein